MNLIDDECVLGGDEAILEPAAGNSGRDDHHVPGRRLGGRLTFAIDDAHLQRCLENRLCHAPDRERFARAGAGHDPEPLAGSGKSSNVVAVLALEQSRQVQAKGQLDCLTGGPCRSDHDDSPSRGLGCEECLRIGREEVVAGDTHCWNIEKREAPCLGGCGDRNSHCLPAVPSRISRTTSPDSAWRFVLFFE